MEFIMQNKKSNYNEIIETIINNKKSEIFSFFNSEEIDLPVTIYVYNSKEDLVNGMRERGYKNAPHYMCACQRDEDNSLNFFEPKDNSGEKERTKEEYENVIFHELIHCIQFNLFGTTPEWINEGIAKYLDGTYSKGIKWLLENYINNNSIPKQEEIENEFGMHEYDSYDYAYLMVSFLIEKLGKENFVELLKDKNKLISIKNNLLNKAINYYNSKYFSDSLDIYLNQDIENPIYLFHGSPNKMNKVVPKQSHDSNGIDNNIANAVFLFPSFLKATPYAFKDTIKANSNGLHWNFIIPNSNDYPLMIMENVNIESDIIGYIYVFKKDNDMVKDDNSFQYKCYKELIPIDVIEVNYSDYSNYYEVKNNEYKSSNRKM